ncbi:MAG: ATP-binding protein [Daejeonella sp.]|uniref:ATP-binding protein n=1 Tax=Daejeonella sp. TaxID=2805397 RepID=UPI0027358745|nr:ATP-binding protein [Daejeonella sp.]MDP3468471.1 ATP-binding protein [Daejeonella sp.]
MDLKPLKANADVLSREMQWLALVIDTRMKLYFSQDSDYNEIYELPAPVLESNDSVYASVVNYYNMTFNERIILSLALAPHIQPHLLDIFFIKNSTYDRGFTEVGGIKGQNHGGFIPTGETAAFIIAGLDLEKRFNLINIFGEDHFFRKFKILDLVHTQPHEPFLSGVITVSPEFLSYFTSGVSHKPDYGINFPAKLITTNLDWSDLVLEENILEEVNEIKDWIEYGHTLMNDWGMSKKFKPGFRTLFYGPPGTGKTLTASLLGKSSGLDVYRIDLSMVVSKFIGETEKNLANVFDQAENKNWILFFDEADALFGKRTQTSSSNDRHANQEVSYLLQRVEDFPGVVILATNLKANLDDAFSRRFQSMIYFPMPGPEQRKRLWNQAFSTQCTLEEACNLEEIAKKYEMAGGAIINVSRYSSMKALKRGTNVILRKDIIEGIRKEFGKEGKLV